MFRRLMQAYLARRRDRRRPGRRRGTRLAGRPPGAVRLGNLLDALAPTNFPWSNPAVLKETLDTGGANLRRGARRLDPRIGARRGCRRWSTPRSSKSAGNLAVTPGSVVLRTEVFELIQYKPRTEQVRAVPLLFVPPTINKYYILDLAPGRSMVEYLLEQGQQVFMMSWRNPDAEQGHFDLDTYAGAVLEARDAVARDLWRRGDHLNAACSGGMIAAAALAHLGR